MCFQSISDTEWEVQSLLRNYTALRMSKQEVLTFEFLSAASILILACFNCYWTPGCFLEFQHTKVLSQREASISSRNLVIVSISSLFPSFQRWWEKAAFHCFQAVLSVASFGLSDLCFSILLRSAAPVFTYWVICLMHSLKIFFRGRATSVCDIGCSVTCDSLAFFFLSEALLVREESKPGINS